MIKRHIILCIWILFIPFSNLAFAESKEAIKKITILQMNDVYEMDPVAGGKEGGLARVATLRDLLIKENPNTITVLAGDLFSPSALGTAPYEGGRLAGKQMVATMNVLGLDYATFGNHEFDVSKEDFYKRLSESNFEWIASNAFDEKGKAFPNVADTKIIEINGLKLGIFSVMIEKNVKDYVSYTETFATAEKKVAELRPQVDILIALTHLTYENDIKLAQKFPAIDMIMGGHEHENMQFWRGINFTPIFKADANARSVYIHRLEYNPKATKKIKITSELKTITPALVDQKKTSDVIAKWRSIGYQGFEKAGFKPSAVVVTTNIDLDGRESSVRNNSTALTTLVAQSMLLVTPQAQLAFYNGGSIRIDDILPAGQITQYDVIRVLPFGGEVVQTKMKGALLKRTLDQGLANKGSGGYLQTANVSGGGDQGWLINGKIIEDDQSYMIATVKFLLTVGDNSLEFLVNNPEVPLLKERGDIRKALIQQLEVRFNQP